MAAKDHTANGRTYDERANEEEEEKKRKGSKPLEQKRGCEYMDTGIQAAIQTLSGCADSARPRLLSLSLSLSHACIEERKKERRKEGKERRIAENASKDVRGKTQGRES